MRGTIVCDVTDPLAGRSAAAFAGAIGSRVGLRLVLVHVVPGRRASSDGSNGPGALGDADRALGAIVQELGGGAETRIAFGRHVDAVARVAAEEGADLIVIGARPAGVGGRNLRGGLVRELEAATAVPVLAAPPSTRKRSGRRLAAAADGD